MLWYKKFNQNIFTGKLLPTYIGLVYVINSAASAAKNVDLAYYAKTRFLLKIKRAEISINQNHLKSVCKEHDN